MTAQSGASAAAAEAALTAYSACLDANLLPLALSTGDVSSTPHAGLVFMAVKMLQAAGVIGGPITGVPIKPENQYVPDFYLVQEAWTPGSTTADQLKLNLAAALASFD